MARAQGARAEMRMIDEVTYGTSPGTGYTKVPFVSTNLGMDQPLQDSNLLGVGRDPVEPVRDAVTVDGDVVIPMDVRAIGRWLKGTFGAPVTSGAGPYTHSFRSGGWTLPSLSVEVGMPEVPRFAMYQGVVVNELSFPMQRAGLLDVTAKLMAQNERRDTVTEDAAAAMPVLARFGNWEGAIRRDTVLLGNVVSANFKYSNNLDRIETIRADGKIDGLDPSMAECSGSVTMRFADTTMMDQALAGGACDLNFILTKGAYSLSWRAHAVFLEPPRTPIEGPKGVQATFNWKAALDAVTGRMATVTLINDVASY